MLFLLAIGFLVFKNRYRKGSQASLHGGGDEEEGLMKSTIDTTINEPGKCVRAGTEKDPVAPCVVDEMRRAPPSMKILSLFYQNVKRLF